LDAGNPVKSSDQALFERGASHARLSHLPGHSRQPYRERAYPTLLGLQSPGSAPTLLKSIFGRTAGPLRRFIAGAHVSEFLTKIDELGFWARSLVRRVRVHTATKGYFHAYGHRKVLQRPKGFGFIQPNNGEKDVFVHATSLERAGINGLREGQKVAFDTRTIRAVARLSLARSRWRDPEKSWTFRARQREPRL
jgi:cold shock protein